LFIQIYALFKLSESFICMFATSNVNFVWTWLMHSHNHHKKFHTYKS
jgi:hypothetical protein